MMLKKITDALNARKEIAAWTVQQVVSRESQIYAVQGQIEYRRSVSSENYKIDVL